MSEKYISVDLDDPRAERIAEVISNKTSKKILGLLAEREMSATEIASELKIPLNTAGYNLEKLVETGLIEKVKGFLWSVKGKKIEKYKVSNKKVLISPKRMIRGILPALLVTGAVAFGIKAFTEYQIRSYNSPQLLNKAAETAASGTSAGEQFASINAPATSGIVQTVSIIAQNSWLWFLAGAFVALFIYLIWNWRTR